MKADTVVTLTPLDQNGQAQQPFFFSNAEVPVKIAFGGEQLLAVHQLIGGKRVVDAMGKSDMPLSWGGLFQGSQSLPRARYLDYLRSMGNKCLLTWSELSYNVVIQQYQADYERFYQIPYQISCMVVEDNAKPQTTAPYTIDQAIGNDMNAGLGLGSLIGDGVLSGLLNNLQSAISAVTTFAGAVQSTIQSVLAPIQAIQARVTTLIASTSNTITSVTTLGGILPYNPVAQMAGKLTNQVVAMQQQPLLYQLQSAMGRMTANLNNVNASSNTITLAGGNLLKVAQQQYGDATDWTTIAQANNLTDPVLTGQHTLNIPNTAASNGGILNN